MIPLPTHLAAPDTQRLPKPHLRSFASIRATLYKDACYNLYSAHRQRRSGRRSIGQHPQLCAQPTETKNNKARYTNSPIPGATSCITQALPASCNLSPSCICADTSFISTISCCVSTACDTAGQQAALAYAQSICSPVGVTNLVCKNLRQMHPPPPPIVLAD